MPSLTETVMIDAPVWSAAGVIVNVRLEPLPPPTIFASGTKPVLEDDVVTVKVLAADSVSLIVNDTVALWFIEVIWLGIDEIEGAPTVMVNCVEVRFTPSDTDTVMTAEPC